MRCREENTLYIDPNDIKTRDYNMLLIIAGATKAAIHVDKRKENNRKACRNWKNNREE
jgi:hypothetical protein